MNILFLHRNLLILAIVLFAFPLFAHESNHNQPRTSSKSLSFIENKGQWIDEAKFKADLPGGVVFLTDNGFVYNYSSHIDNQRIHDLYEEGKDVSEEIINFHSYRVNFAGSNNSHKYVSEEKRTYYHNYFLGNDPSKWAGHVGLFGKVTQENIYEGIDLVVYAEKTSLKYDFIVSPNSNPDAIALEFEGVTPQITQNGDLLIKTTVNEVIEQAPYSYQIINDQKVEVASNYKLKDKMVHFEFPNGYNKEFPLVIDPTLIFATYSGAVGAAAYSYATTYDENGSLYAGTDSWGTGWPVTIGSFQQTFAGGAHDVGINKYNELGTDLVYSTYYGGSAAEYPHAMIVNDQNELILVGHTLSTNLPVTTGAYNDALNGGRDIFVAHFDDEGASLIGATYIGTSSNEPNTFTMDAINTNLSGQNNSSPLEVNFDNAGNIWIVSNTPATNFPTTANAFQATSGGNTDGVIFQLDPTCSNLMYSSYIGGDGNDLIFGIQFNNDQNIVICGVTQSTDFPTTSGVLNATAPGGVDGFVSIINPVTGALIASTYVGTTEVDQAVNIQIDKENNIYVLGRTLGDYPIESADYNIENGDIFIDKLNADLTESLSSTRLGTQQNTSVRYFPTSFLLDMCENVYVAGLGATSFGSESILPGNLPVTNDAFSINADEFWFVALKPHFEDILFGSYYGSPQGDHTHVGVNRMDPNGIVYHSVCSASSAFPVTPGVFGETKLNSGQDIVSFKFDFDASGVRSAISLPSNQKDTVCAPYTINFENNSTSPYNNMEFKWDFSDGNTSTAMAPSHTFTEPGEYEVILHTHSDSACIEDDWDTLRIVVLYTELPDVSVSDTTICGEVSSLDLTVDVANPSPNNIFKWEAVDGILSPDYQQTITVDPSVNQTYYVTVKDTIPGICGFSVRDTIHIDFAPRALDIITNDTVVCEGTTFAISAYSAPNYTFEWSPGTGVSDSTALEPLISVYEPTIYTLTASHEGCPDTSQIISIGMHSNPHVELGDDKEVCEWDEVELESSVTPFRNDYIYTWTPSIGLNQTNEPNAFFHADTSITYYLKVETEIGCSDEDSIKILVHPGNFATGSLDTAYCPPNEVELWASGGVNYEWTPAYGLSQTNISNPIANPATTTNYTSLITDEFGCKDTVEVLVEVHPLGVLSIPDSVTVYPGEEYHVEPQTNALYFEWFPSSGVSNKFISDPFLSPSVRTRYFVTAVTEHGCEVKDSMDVLVKETVLDMPNAFNPGSQNNNEFKIQKRGIVNLKSFSIYNRWGNKVFETSNIENGWDGSFNGTPQPMGVYLYTIEAETIEGQSFQLQGNVTLIR